MTEIGRPYKEFPAKRSWSVLDYGIDWAGFLSRVREPGAYYVAGTRIRLEEPNGYEYEASTGGQTAARAPRVFPVIPDTSYVPDGSVLWRCRDLSDASLRTTIATSVWLADPDAVADGVTLTAETLVGTRTLVTMAGGVSGATYSLFNRVTFANGQRAEGELRIPVNDG